MQLCGTATAVLFTLPSVLARTALSWRGWGRGPETGDEDVSEVLRNPMELQVWSTSGPVCLACGISYLPTCWVTVSGHTPAFSLESQEC